MTPKTECLTTAPIMVIKVGGSLFDRPDLGPQLLREMKRFPGQRLLLVPGGGATANAVRGARSAPQSGRGGVPLAGLSGLVPQRPLSRPAAPGRRGRGARGRLCGAMAPGTSVHPRWACFRAGGRRSAGVSAALVASHQRFSRGAGGSGRESEPADPAQIGGVSSARGLGRGEPCGLVDAFFPRALPPGLLVEAVNCRVRWD